MKNRYITTENTNKRDVQNGGITMKEQINERQHGLDTGIAAHENGERNNHVCPCQTIIFDESRSFHYGYTCNDCPRLNWNDTRNGKVWCTYFNRYEDPHSSANDCPGRSSWC